MNVERDKTYGDKPWLISGVKSHKVIIPDDTVREGAFRFWVLEEGPEFPIYRADDNDHIDEVQKGKTEYPDAIFDREQQLMREYKERHHLA